MVRRRVWLGVVVVMMGISTCFADMPLPAGFEDERLAVALADSGGCGDGICPPWTIHPEWVISVETTAIWSLAGLDQAVNLCSASLTDGTFSDVSPVGDLTKLTHLNVSRNAVRDIAPLGNLATLDVLVLDGNRIVDVAPLAGVDRLWWLYLADNSLQDIAPLASLTGLQRLDLRGNPLNAAAYDTWLPLIEANNPAIALQYDPLIPRADADMDGDVDLDDFIALKHAFGSDGGWQDGDFDGDGRVTLGDFVLLKQNYGTTPVPEPATLMLLALGAGTVLRPRGRRAGR
ncbi:MAG: PEP-CTERM sorting domain-containing protein [Planctomycetota bacterium]